MGDPHTTLPRMTDLLFCCPGFGKLLAVLAVLAANVVGGHVVHQPQLAIALLLPQLHAPHTRAAIPQTGVALGTIGAFVVGENHVGFWAANVNFHNSRGGFLTNVPHNVVARLVVGKRGLAVGPQLGEIELVIGALQCRRRCSPDADP